MCGKVVEDREQSEGNFFSALQRDQHRSAVNNSHKRTSTRTPLDGTFDSRVKPLLKNFMSTTGK